MKPVTSKSGKTLLQLQRGNIEDQLVSYLAQNKIRKAINTSGLQGITFDLEALDIIDWLRRVKFQPKVYFSSRDGELELAGAGVTIEITRQRAEGFGSAWKMMEQITGEWKGDSFLRFFGGTCFDQASQSEQPWEGFPVLWFFLPKITITRLGEKYFITAAIKSDVNRTGIEEKLRECFTLAELQFSDDLLESQVQVRSREDTPDRDSWLDNISALLSQIKHNNIDKVVLARQTKLELTGQIDPYVFLATLKKSNRNCFSFLFEPERGCAFVGATPERLFRVTGNKLESEAIGGTTAIGATDAEEKHNSQKLLSSPKELAEHTYIVDAIRQQLHSLCNDVKINGQPGILKLGNVQHLISHLRGVLKSNYNLSDIVTALHPTPAVCGTPRDKALELIRKTEPFDRGWYAGPVGFISSKSAEMVVAIRSALVHRNAVSLFAGAGIVDGSVPEMEWEEIENKISTALNLLSGAKN